MEPGDSNSNDDDHDDHDDHAGDDDDWHTVHPSHAHFPRARTHAQKQTQTNANKRKQTQTNANKRKQTQANANKRKQTQTNAKCEFHSFATTAQRNDDRHGLSFTGRGGSRTPAGRERTHLHDNARVHVATESCCTPELGRARFGVRLTKNHHRIQQRAQ